MAKEKAAIEFCKGFGWSYKVVKLLHISKKEVFHLRREESVKLSPKWEN